MTRSREEVHLVALVIVRSLILVQHPQSNRSSQGDAEFGAGLDFNFILFVSGGGDGALSGAPACQLWLYVGLCELHAWRTAIDDCGDGRTVGFTCTVLRVRR